MARPATPSRPAPAKPPVKRVETKAQPKQAAAPPKAKPQPKPARRRGSEAVGLFVSCGAILLLAIVALPVCVLLVVGMVPSIVAYVVDQTPRRTLTLTVGPLNLAGTAPYCMQLWFGVDTLHSLGLFLGSAWVWLVMYLAAAIGWLLHLGMPVIVHFLLERSIDLRKSRLVHIQKKLRAEWGDEVAAAAPAASVPAQQEA